MEHIPKVTSGLFKDNIAPVPFLPSECRYGDTAKGIEGFNNYPRENGYSSKGLKHQHQSKEDQVAFVQSWLFFGLLTETFGGPLTQFNGNEFIDWASSPQPLITTGGLQKYAWYWQAIQMHETIDDTLEHAARVDACLQLTCAVVNGILSGFELPKATPICRWPRELVCILSIIAVAEYICNVRESIAVHTRTRIGRLNLEWKIPFINDALSAAGWCDGEIWQLAQTNNVTCRYYLSTIDRHALGKDHKNCVASTGCRTHQLDYNKYFTQHTRSCLLNTPGTCGEIGPAMNSIARVLNTGDIPVVVQASDHRRSSTRVKTTSLHSVDRYVAVSHVWSDGLGNLHRNCLQACQFREIQKLVNDLYEPSLHPVHFWMDTLCVPVGADYADLKVAAISRMAETYRLADKVLVLDNSLRNCTGEMSQSEILIRLSHSAWLTRVWTLQEGRLARNLYIQFPGRAVPFDGLTDPTMINRHSLGLSKMLGSQDRSYRRSNPCARRLICALSTGKLSRLQIEYSRKPRQDDPSEEALRLAAVEELRNRVEENKLAEVWTKEANTLGIQSENVDADEHLRVFLEAVQFCHVLEKATVALRKIQGHHQIIVSHERDTLATNESIRFGALNSPTSLLTNVCRAFTGRTTSRVEDESLCLSILLGADPTEILNIKPLDWRTKDLLKILNANHHFAVTALQLGFDVQEQLQACQEARMKLLLSRIRVYPSSIIFWQCKRLRFDGWKWAPLSVLQARWPLDDFFDNTFAKLDNHGLNLQMPAFRLSARPEQDVGLPKHDLDTDSKDEEVLVVHTKTDGTTDGLGSRRSWQQLIMVRGPASGQSIVGLSWSSLRDRKLLNSVAILHQRDQGVLVSIEQETADLVTAHHMIPVRRFKQNTSTQGTKQIHVNGTWVSEQNWCIR
ncbi:MAG: hypothetical protein MMC23_004640 [Stictis urceolatum]|nr:hypothetical protein [Stictis urceolata]